MKVLICPDKFKGTASAPEVAKAIQVGVLETFPDTETTLLPIADGGEGFAATAASFLEGEEIKCVTIDALHHPLTASYFISNNTAYLDMSAASGINKISTADLDPMLSSTRGVGIMMRHAIENYDVSSIIVGLGGSATNDGGAGMAHELGVRFLDTQGRELSPIPADLIHCVEISTTNKIKLPAITAACDVTNVLLGPEGATAIYGPQKGVIRVDEMDAILHQLVIAGNGTESVKIEGSGAAGGLAYGLLHYAGATLNSGFDLIAQISDLEQAIVNADIVITGEGSLDSQTLNGKGPHGVARLAQSHNKPVYAIAGKVEDSVKKHFSDVVSLTDSGYTLAECINNTEAIITVVVQRLNFNNISN